MTDVRLRFCLNLGSLAVVLSLIVGWLWWLPWPAHADDYHVDTERELQTALDDAGDNGQDDTVYVAAGVYGGPFDCRPKDGRNLIIRGELGTTADDVMLDGENTQSVLRLQGSLAGRVRLQGLTIQHGRTPIHGGGIFVNAWADTQLSLEISDSVIRFNQAENRGGGLGAKATGGNSRVSLILVNTLIYGNRAAWTGGGMDVTATEVGENNTMTVRLVNCSVTGNVSDSDNVGAEKGGGVRIRAYQGSGAYASLTMYNTIVHGNTQGEGEPQDVVVDRIVPGLAEMNAHHCDIGDVDGDLGVYTPVRVISADPAFFDPKRHDYHLRVGSPCRDAGTAAVPTPPGLPGADFEGEPRSIGMAPDIGADEFSPGVHREVYLPLLRKNPG